MKTILWHIRAFIDWWNGARKDDYMNPNWLLDNVKWRRYD